MDGCKRRKADACLGSQPMGINWQSDSLDMRYKQKRYNKCLMYGNIWYAHKIVYP